MEGVTAIGPCARCGRVYRKDRLHLVSDLFTVKALCKDCYARYQRQQWGYW